MTKPVRWSPGHAWIVVEYLPGHRGAWEKGAQRSMNRPHHPHVTPCTSERAKYALRALALLAALVAAITCEILFDYNPPHFL